MNWMAAIIAGTVFSIATAGGFFASTHGTGLPGSLDKPVSIRQESKTFSSRTGHRTGYYFFGASGRRHFGGGFHGGK